MRSGHQGTIVVADDMAGSLDVLCRLLTRDGYTVHGAPDGTIALDLVHRVAPDLVLSDVMMPALNGFELCRRIKSDSTTRLTPVVLITGLHKVDDRIAGIDAGADDFLTKPFNVNELRARVKALIGMKRYTDDLDCAESVIMSLALTVEARDANTGGHCERLATYAAALGRQLGLPDDDLGALHRGGYLHDIGKISVPDAILLKAARLTADEYAVTQEHTIAGDRLCGNLRLLRDVRQIVRHHHERLDGSGYPDGLSGGEVPLLAQIMGIVDVYDALTSARPYRRPISSEAACDALEAEAQRGWRSPELVAEFIALCRSGRLSTVTSPSCQ